MEQVALEVSDLDSRERERAVTSALINVPGVQWATASSRAHAVSVQYDPGTTDLRDLQEALEASGYEPRA